MSILQRITGLFVPGLFPEYFYPRRCVICSEDGVGGVCDTCYRSFTRVDYPFCFRCGKPLVQAYRTESCGECYAKWKHVDRARSLFAYKPPALTVLHRFKYQNRIGLGKFFAKALLDAFPNRRSLSAVFNWEPVEEPILILSIPIHPVKKFTRGFNQNEVVLQFCKDTFGIPMSNLMFRRKYTRSQVGLTENLRFENVRRAFGVSGRLSRLIEGKSVLLFDDLITTGATINSAARALKQVGAKHVFALSLYTAVKS